MNSYAFKELCSKNKDKKSESNSQHTFEVPENFVGCVRRTKIKNLKAIHNNNVVVLDAKSLCSKNKDKKSESNSQLVTVQHVWLHSVPEKASSGTEYACRAQKGFLVYATRFQKPSVLKTGFWGTEGIFGTRNPLLRYGAGFHVCRERPSGVPTEAEERGSGSEIGDFAKNGHLYAPATAAKQLRTAVGCHQTAASRFKSPPSHFKSPQTVMDYLKLPPTSLNYRRLLHPTARLPPSRPDRYQAPANYAGAYQ